MICHEYGIEVVFVLLVAVTGAGGIKFGVVVAIARWLWGIAIARWLWGSVKIVHVGEFSLVVWE